MKARTIQIPVDHPAFPGHFPGNPLLPGVLILELVVDTYQSPVNGISIAKFLQPVSPGDILDISIDDPSNGTARFKVTRSTNLICEGQLRTEACDA